MGDIMKQDNQKKELPKDQDGLEAYPTKKQVDSFPERRYIKMTRFLTIFTIVNLAMLMASAGIYFYMAKHKDISISRGGRIHLYSIDPEKKLLLPAEPGNRRISSMQLIVEKSLRRYLEERYSSIASMEDMQRRWGERDYVAYMSTEEVFLKFVEERDRAWNEIWRNRVTRDVHIYSLEYVHSDLWEAYIETFDLPFEDDLKKKCDCTDNSKECLACKEENMIPDGRKRKKIWLRINFAGQKGVIVGRDGKVSYDNPFGLLIYAYYSADIPISSSGDNKKLWDLPPALMPEI